MRGQKACPVERCVEGRGEKVHCSGKLKLDTEGVETGQWNVVCWTWKNRPLFRNTLDSGQEATR